jgi:hypothetical protein
METIYSFWSGLRGRYIVYRDGMLLQGDYRTEGDVLSDYPNAVIV